MWQSVLTVTTVKKQIDYIDKELLKISKLSFVKKTEKTHTIYFLSSDIKSKNEVLQKLYDIVATLILVFYKYNYLSSSIKIEDFDAPMCSLISCLLHFDYGYEKKVLDEILFDLERYDIDGIINFRIEEIKSNWTELTQLTEGLFYAGCTDAEIYRLMTFVLNNSSRRNQKVFVAETEDGFLVTNTTKSCVVENVVLFANETLDLLNTIISQTPSEVVFENDKAGECLNILKNFVRVKIINKS